MRSGWQMKVSIAPSLVVMSSVFSIKRCLLVRRSQGVAKFICAPVEFRLLSLTRTATVILGRGARGVIGVGVMGAGGKSDGDQAIIGGD